MRWRRVIVALLAGTATTVAVAWLAMFLPIGNTWYGPPTDEGLGLWKNEDGSRIWRITRGTNAWHRVVSYWHVQISGMSLMMEDADYQPQAFDYTTLPARFRPESLDDLTMLAWYHESGWPLAAMTCSVHWEQQVRNSDIIYAVQGGLQLPRDAEFNPRALPMTPLATGFIANTLLYTLLWLGMIQAVCLTRDRIRSRRDGCRKCGYPRFKLPAGSACPECGYSTPTASASRSESMPPSLR